MNLLSIKHPEQLFSEGSKVAVIREYRELARAYHPDMGGDEDSFTHLNKLYLDALEKLSKGEWQIPGQFTFKDKSSTYRLKFVHSYPFSLGKVYMSNNTLLYSYDKDYTDFCSRFKNSCRFRFSSDRMKHSIRKNLPSLVKLSTDRVIVMNKETNSLPLRVLLDYYNGSIDPVHAAWIINSMFHVASYLNYIGKAHMNFTLDNFFVDPATHTGFLYGGWEYVIDFGKRIKFISVEGHKVLTGKVANNKIDCELIKQAGREIMGKFFSKKKYPEYKEMIDYLNMPVMSKTVEEFGQFETALEKTFGEPKFVGMKIDVIKTLKEEN